MSTQKYKDGGVMEKSVLGNIIRIINHKKGMTTTEVKDVVGIFCEFTWSEYREHFKYTITSK